MLQLSKGKMVVPDISMCVGGDCSMKKDCYRYRAIPDTIQMFFTIPPKEGKVCEYFRQIEKGHKIRCMDEIESKNDEKREE